jgi:hypothetical protein
LTVRGDDIALRIEGIGASITTKKCPALGWAKVVMKSEQRIPAIYKPDAVMVIGPDHKLP